MTNSTVNMLWEQTNRKTTAVTSVRQYLELTAEMSAVSRFLLRNGRRWGVGPDTYDGPRGRRGQCYKNAALMALERRELTYVEGLATVVGVPLSHAWLVDGEGQVIDPTWGDGAGYFGVAFSTEYLLRCITKNGRYGLLDGRDETCRALVRGATQKSVWKR